MRKIPFSCFCLWQIAAQRDQILYLYSLQKRDHFLTLICSFELLYTVMHAFTITNHQLPLSQSCFLGLYHFITCYHTSKIVCGNSSELHLHWMEQSALIIGLICNKIKILLSFHITLIFAWLIGIDHYCGIRA